MKRREVVRILEQWQAQGGDSGPTRYCQRCGAPLVVTKGKVKQHFLEENGSQFTVRRATLRCPRRVWPWSRHTREVWQTPPRGIARSSKWEQVYPYWGEQW